MQTSVELKKLSVLENLSKPAEDGDGIGKTNKTSYRRQKAHVNKADICAILRPNETSTAPFPRRL